MERLRAIGKRHNCFPGAVAVAWTLRHPAVTAAIVGARKPEQMDDVVAAAAIRLSQSELDEIEGSKQPGQIWIRGFAAPSTVASLRAGFPRIDQQSSQHHRRGDDSPRRARRPHEPVNRGYS